MTPLPARRLLTAVTLFAATAFLAAAPSADPPGMGDKKADKDGKDKGGQDKGGKGRKVDGPAAKDRDGDGKKAPPKKDPDGKNPPGKDAPAFRHHLYTDAGGEMDYWVFVPRGQARGPLPVILFLHGHGARKGGEVSPTAEGIGPYVKAHDDTFPFLVVIPQARRAGDGGPDGWGEEERRRALAVLAREMKAHNGDPARVYLTGYSIGGSGVWAVAAADPTPWAAIVPVAGWTYQLPADAPKTLAGLPCKCFHGVKDRVVRPKESERMVDAINKFAPDGRKAVYVPLADEDHACCEAVFKPALFAWLLRHRK